ncbi:MAG: DNA recombination protein RmuC [Acidobacteriaceae bacterium]|nr:DNA recombination protein RmuC [Acidobacteriaceae bacterium]
MTFLIALLIIVAVCAAGVAVYELGEGRRWRQMAAEAREQCEQQRSQLDEARRSAIQLEAESAKNREIAEVQLKLLTQTREQLEQKFRSLAAEALQTNSQMFLDRTREQMLNVVEPVNQSLRRFEEQVRELELSRVGAYESITAQVQNLTQLQERVRQSADELKTALRSPIQRGRWGEIQLRRVVELAGMLEYCDFCEQKTLFGDSNQRPDLIVRLPNDCQLVVDSKVSLEAYLRAIESPDEAQRVRYLREHAQQVKAHVKSLGEKSYWERLPGSPDFVVAFLPLESLFSAALEHEPGLLDAGIERRVVIATPTTLITLLLTVAHGWRQHALSEGAEKIRVLGSELYTRLLTMSDHFARLGEAIGKTVATYNQTVGSLERNVLSSARKLKELRPANSNDLQEVEIIDSTPRSLDQAKWVMSN